MKRYLLITCLLAACDQQASIGERPDAGRVGEPDDAGQLPDASISDPNGGSILGLDAHTVPRDGDLFEESILDAGPPGIVAYGLCTDTSPCASAQDSCVAVTTETASDAFCTRSCVDDRDCVNAGSCVSFDGARSFCYQACVTNAACQPGWACSDLSDGRSVCLPGSSTPAPTGIPAYHECDPSSDSCGSRVDGCFTIQVDGATAGVCTSSCRAPGECPFTTAGLRGECISFDSGGNFTCFEPCRASNDCLAGFACKSAIADGSTFPPICLPI